MNEICGNRRHPPLWLEHHATPNTGATNISVQRHLDRASSNIVIAMILFPRLIWKRYKTTGSMHVKFRTNIKTLCLECCKSTITNMAKTRNIEVAANKRRMYTKIQRNWNYIFSRL